MTDMGGEAIPVSSDAVKPYDTSPFSFSAGGGDDGSLPIGRWLVALAKVLGIGVLVSIAFFVRKMRRKSAPKVAHGGYAALNVPMPPTPESIQVTLYEGSRPPR